MSNGNFILLMKDFMQLMNIHNSDFGPSQALVGSYGEFNCRIEDGSRIGLFDKMIILVELKKYKLDAQSVLKLNSNITLLSGSYVTEINNRGFFLTKIYNLPSHVNQLNNKVNELITIAKKINDEMPKICG